MEGLLITSVSVYPRLWTPLDRQGRVAKHVGKGIVVDVIGTCRHHTMMMDRGVRGQHVRVLSGNNRFVDSELWTVMELWTRWILPTSLNSPSFQELLEAFSLVLLMDAQLWFECRKSYSFCTLAYLRSVGNCRRWSLQGDRSHQWHLPRLSIDDRLQRTLLSVVSRSENWSKTVRFQSTCISKQASMFI